MKKILLSIVAFLCLILQLPTNSLILNAADSQEDIMIYKLVESNEDLILGKNFVIVDESLSYAMIKDDANSNFDPTPILNFKENGTNYVKISEKAQTFKLGVGAIENTYSFQNDLGYLTNFDYLTEVEEKSSWNITFDNGFTLSNCYYTNGLYFDTEKMQFTSVKKDTFLKSLLYIQCELDEIDSISLKDDLNAEILSLKEADALAKEVNEIFTTDKYLIQGTISGISNYTYGNLFITDYWDNTLYIYGVWCDKGNTRYDSIPNESKPGIGDKVILYGTLGTYANLPEMKNSWLITYQPHDHLYKYKYDETYHSKVCSFCQDEINKTEHTLIEETVEPTCAVDGYKLIHCDCGYYQRETYRATGKHSMTLIEYNWSNDHLKCYATCTCSVCNYSTRHNAIVTVTNPSKQCEVPGILRYTATFSSSSLTTQIYDVDVARLPHDYKVTSHKWAEDYSTCTIKIVCQNNGVHQSEYVIKPTTSTLKPTCTNDGEITYIASLTAFNYTTRISETLPKTGHKIFTKNTGYFPGKLQVRLEHECIYCDYKETEFVSMFTYFTSKNDEGCKGSTTSFIAILSLLGLLVLKKHK